MLIGRPNLGVTGIRRGNCPRCGDVDALFSGARCCSCGAVSKSTYKFKRPRWNGPLKAPVAEAGGNLLALMKAKA
jgi:hypothetical protein